MPYKYADFEPEQRLRYNARDAGIPEDEIDEMFVEIKRVVSNGVPPDQARSLIFMTYASAVPNARQPRYRKL